MSYTNAKRLRAAMDELTSAGFTVTPKAPIDPEVKHRARQLFYRAGMNLMMRGVTLEGDRLGQARDEAIRAVHAAYYDLLAGQWVEE
jgi:hypothetical protein